MILDNLKNANKFLHISPLFKNAFDFVEKLDLSKTENGKIIIVPEKLFLTISDCELRQAENAKLEVHNQFIDIQIPIDQTETFGWKSRISLHEPISDFDKVKDIQFFNDTPDSFVNVKPNNFVVFFPGDAHAPSIGNGNVRKMVLKIKYECLN